MSIALPSAATLTGTTLVVPGLTLAAGQRVTLLYVDDAGAEIPLSTWHADADLPLQAALLATRTEDLAAATVYNVTADDLNTALTLRIYSDVYVNLPPPPAGGVPALLRIANEAAGSSTDQITVPGHSRPLRNGDFILLAALATPGQGTQWVIISSSAQLLDPLSYPVMVGTQVSGYVGYASLEAACFAAPFRPLVLNVPYLLLENDLTLTGNLSAAAQTALVLGPGVTLTVNTGVQLQSLNVQRFNSAGQKVVIASTQGGVSAAWQGIQLVDSRIGPDLYFSDATHLVAARGRSRVDALKGGPGTLYLFDVATVISTASAPSVNVVDLRPGAGFLPNVAAEPATPAGGGVLYVQNGALKYKGSGGTVTPLASA